MQHRYFAASNSSDGFKSYFSEIFEGADLLYVIKGGPGTGKSWFMKKCALEAERKGAEVEYYYCSSDPASLDGVLMKHGERTVGIIDGTPPHTWEPNHPGVTEELVNLGAFWNPAVLRGQKNEIMALSGKKSTAYKRAYDYLRSCGNLRAVTDSLLRSAVDAEKLRGAVERQVRALGHPHGRLREIPALRGAVSMSGLCVLDSFEANAKICIHVANLYGVGRMYLGAIREALQPFGVTARISYDPVDPRCLDGILIEETGVAFLLADKGEVEESEKTVNTRRFVHQDALREVRGELRYAARLYDECLDGAVHALSEAKVYHFLLEDIYKHAMDFPALTRFAEKFAEELGEAQGLCP